MSLEKSCMQDINQLAKKFVEGVWLYNANDKTLKKLFASNRELTELNLIDENGYLDSTIKSAIMNYLGTGILNSGIVGPFGDSDFFSGEMEENITFYNIELCNITEVTIDILKKFPNITIEDTP